MGLCKIFLLYFGLFAAIAVNFAQAARSKRMIVGNLTEHSNFPYQVRILKIYKKSVSTCGGSILDNNHIISAAHCFITDKFPYLWKNGSYLVVAGATDYFDRTNWVTTYIQKIYIPKMYLDSVKNNDVTYVGDIAVAKLELSLNLTKNRHLSAVQLPKNAKLLYTNETAVVSGYGYNKFELVRNKTTGLGEWKGSSDYKLRFANTTVLSNFECQSKWDYFTIPQQRRRENITGRHICAQVNQRDHRNPEGVCKGDSGGPLVYNGNVLIGVINTAPAGCRENKLPGGYARVSAFKDFIEKARNYNHNYYGGPEIITKDPPIER